MLQRIKQLPEALWLVLLTVPAYTVLGWSLIHWQRIESSTVVIVSAVICMVFALLALIAQDARLKSGRGVDGALLSILLRTVCPMIVALMLPWCFWHLPERQIFEAFVGCYLLTLFVETLLSVRLIQRRTKSEHSN